MNSTPPAPSGIVASLRSFGDGLLRSIHDRVALLGIELEEEKLRLVQIVIWIGAAIVASVMALTLGSLTLVLLFWDSARIAVAAGLTVLYVAVLAGIVVYLKRMLSSQPRPFAASLEEITEDRSCLSENEH